MLGRGCCTAEAGCSNLTGHSPTSNACGPVQLRHPNLLAYKDSTEMNEKGATVIMLVTEPVKPLKEVLKELDLQGQHRWAARRRSLRVL